MIATGFLRAGPRVAFREKDNPERRYEYLDDLIATTGRGVLGLTVQCARCHNHKFDPIPQKDYYSLVATFFGYVETNYPLVPPAEAAAYEQKVSEIDAQIASLRAEIKKIEAPHEARLKQEIYKKFQGTELGRSCSQPIRQCLCIMALTGTRALRCRHPCKIWHTPSKPAARSCLRVLACQSAWDCRRGVNLSPAWAGNSASMTLRQPRRGDSIIRSWPNTIALNRGVSVR
jgi:hypothetical protein